MTEIIEGTAVDVTEGAVVVRQAAPSSVDVYERPRVDPLRYLGTMSDEAFRGEVAVIKAGTDRIGQIYKEVMRPEVDYGIIPGTKNPSLLQPGAERLAMMARLIPRHDQRITHTPGENGWPEEIRVDTQTYLHAGALDGPVVGSSVASCSSYEDRYLYRSSERVCPKCQKPVIIRGNPQYAPRTRGREGDVLPGYDQGGWLCWKKKDGCGATFQDNDRAITDQAVGKVFVENPRGLINTLTQISAKRGFVGAIRHTLGITDLFTQDIEDMPAPSTADPGPAQADRLPPENAAVVARSAPPARQATPVTPPAPSGTGATFEGPVVTVPEGWRMTPDGKVLRFAIKVGNSKHNVELWGGGGDLALTLEQRVRVHGVRHEEDWPGRGTGKDAKPMKKVVKEVTAIEDVETGAILFSAAPAAPQPVQQALMAPDEDEGPPMFDDDLFVAPARPEPVQMTAQDTTATVDMTGTLRLIEWKDQPTRFLYLEVVVPGDQFIKVAMKEDEALETIGNTDGTFTVAVGSTIRVMGGWNSKGVMVIAGIVVAA